VIHVDAPNAIRRWPSWQKLFHGWAGDGVHALSTLPFWLAVAGRGVPTTCYMVNPALPAAIKRSFVQARLHRLLENKYYMDWFNENVFARGARAAGHGPVEGLATRR
jgi:NADH-quinone oxidoreductase subunit L